MRLHNYNIKASILLISLTLLSLEVDAQAFCFFNPNTGPIYNSGSAGAIYDAISGDFNSDGHLDIVTANSIDSNISFIPGYSDGTLGTPALTSVSGTLFCITTSDFNDDGKPDIATASNGNIFVLLGNGNGTFQSPVSYPGTGLPSRIYCKDLNNDNIQDLIEAGGSGVFVLTGQGNGSFSTPVQYLLGMLSNDISIADFDGDSVLDIISTTHVDATNSELSFLKGNGNGSFAPVTTIFSMSYPYNFIAGITAEDINNDNMADLLVANSSKNVKRVEVYTANGNGTFNNPVFYSTSYNPFYIYTADFNNDSIKDIVVEESNGFSVLKGSSNGTFSPYQYFMASSTPNTLVIEDFNNDLQTDLIIPSAYFGSSLITVNLNCTTPTIGTGFQKTTNAFMNIYPNPFNHSTCIEWDEKLGEVSLGIFNVYGEQVRQIKNITEQSFELSRSNLPIGSYLLRLVQGEKVISTQQLIITD